MKSKTWFSAACAIVAMVLACVTSISAEGDRPVRFNGVINDYAPTGVTAPDGTPTAWELHGPWSLTLNRESGKAHFSMSLTMGLSVLAQSSMNVQDITLQQHSHNITMDGTVTYNPTDCPAAAASTPAYTARIEIKSTTGASVFANGNVPPFGEFSPLQVCLAGGVDKPNTPFVEFSNITLRFGGGAAGHFGGQAIHGVVNKVKAEDR